MATDHLHNYTLEELTDGSRQQPGSQQAYIVELELRRRREIAQQVVDSAQIEAAAAEVEAARQMKKQVGWAMWSVVALAVTSALSSLYRSSTCCARLNGRRTQTHSRQ